MTAECSSLNELSPSNGPEGSGDILHEDGKSVRAGGGADCCATLSSFHTQELTASVVTYPGPAPDQASNTPA